MNLNSAFAHWLAGFLDGEGCFTIVRHQNRDKSADQRWHSPKVEAGSCWYSPRVSITLRADDRDILEEIAARTGLGKVHLRPDGRPDVADRCDWVVQSKGDQLALAMLLEWFPLRAKKRRDVEIWRDAVIWWNRQQRDPNSAHGAYDWTPMDEWKRALSDVKLYRDHAGIAIPYVQRACRPRTRVLIGRDV